MNRRRIMAIITRPELIDMVSEKIDRKYNQVEIYYILQATFRCFEDILKNGDTLKVFDCFTMKPMLRKERQTGNFGKGNIIIPAHYVPYFRPYKKLVDACASLPVKKR